MISWWAIVFVNNSTGYIKMEDGMCIGVYRSDGTVVLPEEKVEYTCVDMDVLPPPWA